MEYEKCRRSDCSYLVTSFDKFCPNCGIYSPSRGTAGCAWFVLLLIFIGILLGLNSLFGPLVDTDVAFKVAMGLLGAHFIYVVFAWFKYVSVSHLCLNNFEKTIKSRSQDLTNKENQLTVVLTRLSNERDQKWNHAKDIIKERLGVIRTQLAQYKVKMMEIVVLRWQNYIYGHISGLDPSKSTAAQTAESIKLVDNGITWGNQHFREILRIDSIPESDLLLDRIDDTISTFRAVREELMAREATLAIEGTGTLRDALSPVILPDSLITRHTALNESAFTELSEGLRALEFQYEKLHAEDQTAELIRPMIAEAERIRR